MKNYVILVTCLYCSVVAPCMALQWPHISPKKIGPHTYVIEHGPHDEDMKTSHGFHNNPGFVLTKTGVVVIDTGSSYEIGKMILRKIAMVTKKPITHVFTTHFHGDHWIGNQAIVEAYPKVQTIAHPTLITLLKNGEDKVWLNRFSKRLGDAFTGTKAVIPEIAAQNKTYTIGDIKFKVLLFDKAHTETDLMVFVEQDGVLFTGDIVNNVHFSYMGHGNFNGAIAAAKKAIALKPAYIVVGHGRSGDAQLLPTFLSMYEKVTQAVEGYYQQDLADYEMKPKVVQDLKAYANWSNFDEQIGPYISQIITEIEARVF